jgi:hypothetical protein
MGSEVRAWTTEANDGGRASTTIINNMTTWCRTFIILSYLDRHGDSTEFHGGYIDTVLAIFTVSNFQRCQGWTR